MLEKIKKERNECETISKEEVRSTLRKMKSRKATGPDGIAT